MFYGSKIEEDSSLYDDFHSEDIKYYPRSDRESNDCIYGPINPHITADNIPEMASYTINEWDGTVNMLLNNGDSLYIYKIGCRSYRNEGTLIKYNDTHPLQDVKYWLNQVKWISERINKNSIHEDLVNRLNNNEYEINTYDKSFSIDLLLTKSHIQIAYWWIDVREMDEGMLVRTGYSY